MGGEVSSSTLHLGHRSVRFARSDGTRTLTPHPQRMISAGDMAGRSPEQESRGRGLETQNPWPWMASWSTALMMFQKTVAASETPIIFNPLGLPWIM